MLFSATLPDLCGDRYRAFMSSEQFDFIIMNFRFVDNTTRTKRKAMGSLVPIQEIWDMFVMKCS